MSSSFLAKYKGGPKDGQLSPLKYATPSVFVITEDKVVHTYNKVGYGQACVLYEYEEPKENAKERKSG